MDLSVKYMGYTIKNPVIIGSSALSNNIDKIKNLEKNGAAAIVLKSIFEEQILQEIEKNFDQYGIPEAHDYIAGYTRTLTLDNYLKLIEDARKHTQIPIIGSINAQSPGKWVEYAKKIESAGAFGIELNISILPADIELTCKDIEKRHMEILEEVRKAVKIPLSVKISQYVGSLGNMVKKIAWSQTVNTIVMFNRFYNPDIDIEKLEPGVTNVLSNAEDIMPSLRWIAILAEKFENTEFVASTAIYTGEDLIKQILAGADAVQVVSAIYKHGPEFIETILEKVKDWMKEKNIENLSDIKGKMSFSKLKNPAFYERIQFMRYYGTLE